MMMKLLEHQETRHGNYYSVHVLLLYSLSVRFNGHFLGELGLARVY